MQAIDSDNKSQCFDRLLVLNQYKGPHERQSNSLLAILDFVSGLSYNTFDTFAPPINVSSVDNPTVCMSPPFNICCNMTTNLQWNVKQVSFRLTEGMDVSFGVHLAMFLHSQKVNFCISCAMYPCMHCIR